MESGNESYAIICESENRDEFTLKTFNVKEPGIGQVRVQMKYASFSKSDSLQHAYDSDAEYPYLAGYDGVGTVESIGESVEEFEKGDHVAVFHVPGNVTLTGKTNISDFQAKVVSNGKYWKQSPHLDAYTDDKSLAGFMGVGTWSQLAVFNSGHLTKLDHEPTVQDAGLGSVLATGLLGPSKILDLDEGAHIAIFGSNSLGLTLLASVRKQNPKLVVVVGAKEDQELFEKFGAQYIIDEGEAADVHKKLLEA
jgi:aryl-alcohol dehydrogenase